MKSWKRALALFLAAACLCAAQAFAAGPAEEPAAGGSEIVPWGMVEQLQLTGLQANVTVRFDDACGEYTAGYVTFSGDWAPMYADIQIKLVDTRDPIKTIITRLEPGGDVSFPIPYASSWDVYVTPSDDLSMGVLRVYSE